MSFDFAKFRKNAATLGDYKAIEVFDSIEKQEKGGRKLSDRQLNFLMSLALRNSDAAVEASKEFALRMEADYDFREEARIVAQYYSKQVKYFALASTANLILGYLDGKCSVLPTYSEYKRIRDNKYAKNVLESAQKPELWTVGDLVNIRASCAHICWNNNLDRNLFRQYGYRKDESKPRIYDCTFMIIAANPRPIEKSLKYSEKNGGCRYYKLMPLGMSVTVDVMERDLKKTKKIK